MAKFREIWIFNNLLLRLDVRSSQINVILKRRYYKIHKHVSTFLLFIKRSVKFYIR